MRFIAAVTLWFILLAISWPLALIMLFLFPLIWLILIPFRIVGFSLEIFFRFLRGLLLFPFRLLGMKV